MHAMPAVAEIVCKGVNDQKRWKPILKSNRMDESESDVAVNRSKSSGNMTCRR